MPRATTIAIRKPGSNKKAIIFLHGFAGEPAQTFGLFPSFIAGNPQLVQWDVFCFGYPTRLAPDVRGLWSADPDLSSLSAYFAEKLTSDSSEFYPYDEISIIAHSMGGLIAQRALLNDNAADRVQHLILFGTPSGGLKKAKLVSLLKGQVRDMSPGSDFVQGLRRDWADRYQRPSFGFLTVAGLNDEFVPETSSLDPFPKSFHAHVKGNHLEIVKPLSASEESVRYVESKLIGSSEPNLDRPDPAAIQSIVKRALALELGGQQENAIALLLQHKDADTDVAGSLAGRYKRQWLNDPVTYPERGNEAAALYREAFEEAAAKPDHGQAYYLGINTAFMTLALTVAEDPGGQIKEAATKKIQELARRVLAHCDAVTEPDEWLLATRAEAHLYLGEQGEAIKLYGQALGAMGAREQSSTLQQAVWIARLLGDSFLENQLHMKLITG